MKEREALGDGGYKGSIIVDKEVEKVWDVSSSLAIVHKYDVRRRKFKS